jgi:methyl-accepting chemotaxis protein
MFHSASLLARGLILGLALPLATLGILFLARLVLGTEGAPALGLSAMALAAVAGAGLGCGLAALLLGPASRGLAALADYLRGVARGDFRQPLPQAVSGAGDLDQSLATVIGQLKLGLGNLRGLIEALLLPYAMVDRQGNLTHTNRKCLEMLEREGRPEDHEGMFFSEFFYGDRARKALIVDIMETNKGVVRDVEFKNLKGNTRFIQAALSPLHDLDGNVSGGLCMYLDYTDIRCKEDQITCQSEHILSAVKVMEEIAEGLSATSRGLSARVDGAARGAELQNSRVAETSTAMEEMNATVLNVAKSAADAARRAGEAQARAKEGAGVVEKAVEAIHQVEALTGTLKGRMDELSSRAEAIGRIMGVISDIADQTNLLALNAAIEAARAGDAGRGFAVVADEVRKLAEKTMTATKEVGEATGAIQGCVQESIGGTEEAARAVDKATTLAGESGRALASIVELSVATSDQVRAIATAAEQQSAASEEINRGVEDIRQVTAETAASMRESTQAVAELAGQSQALIRLIEDLQRRNQAKG